MQRKSRVSVEFDRAIGGVQCETICSCYELERVTCSAEQNDHAKKIVILFVDEKVQFLLNYVGPMIPTKHNIRVGVKVCFGNYRAGGAIP